VWAVATLPHRQDLVTGCMDNICRIFTRDESRVADEATLQAFQASVGNKKLSSSMVQGVDWDKLPLYEQVIDTPGTREGELKVVKKGNEAQVLIWSQQKWSKFGDVVDNPNNETSSGQSGYLDLEMRFLRQPPA
jgi:phospholipase A-2-activating protein